MLQGNRRRRIGKTRQAKVRIRRIVSQYGAPPTSARNLQMPLVQGTMLYATGLTWSGQKGVEGEYQRAVNRMARSTLGAFRSTPQGILAVEHAHPSMGFVGTPAGQARSAPTCQASGRRRAGGDPGAGGRGHHQGSGRHKAQRDGRATGLERGQSLPGRVLHQQGGPSTGNGSELEDPGHHLGRRIPARQRGG